MIDIGRAFKLFKSNNDIDLKLKDSKKSLIIPIDTYLKQGPQKIEFHSLQDLHELVTFYKNFKKKIYTEEDLSYGNHHSIF